MTTTPISLLDGSPAEIASETGRADTLFWGEHGEAHVEVEGTLLHLLRWSPSAGRFERTGESVAFKARA